MSLLHLETLHIHIPTVGPPDEDGVPITTLRDEIWEPCNVQRSSTSEERRDGEVVTVKLHASGPLAESITSESTVTWRGRDWQVEGEPAHFRGGVLDHTEIDLIRWEGQ